MEDKFQQAKPTTILAILMIYPLPQMAIDIYLPSWPSLIEKFQTNHAALQLSLIVYLFFLGIAQLGYGRLSDLYGRKPLLLIGCSIFLLSTIGCIFANSIETLIIFRIGQALGIGCGFTIASAILSDLFSGNRLAKYTSYSAMIYSLSLISAPFIGGYIQFYLGWQFNFLFMMFYCIILMLMIYYFIFETKKTSHYKTHNSAVKTTYSYLSLFSNFQFNLNILCLIIGYGAMVAFNIVAPILLQIKLKLTAADYGNYVVYVGSAYFLSSTINSHLVKKYSLTTIVYLGFSLMGISGLSLLYSIMFDLLTAKIAIIFSALSFFSVGLIFPNCFAAALDAFEDKGIVSAFIGCAILIGVSVVSLIALYFSEIPETYLSYTLLVSGLFGIMLTYFSTIKLRENINVIKYNAKQ